MIVAEKESVGIARKMIKHGTSVNLTNKVNIALYNCVN